LATTSNLVTAATHNFLVYEGDTTTATLTFTETVGAAAISMAGTTIVMEIKSRISDTDVVETFSTTSADIVISGDDDNVLTISGWERLTKGRYVYDLEVTRGSSVTTFLKGKITVTQDVTE
jgi:UDP-N-acetylglucosamine enolpyruvyl transferase